MTIPNPSFETVFDAGAYEVKGLPAGWSSNLGGTSWEWATFTAISVSAEDFEAQWSGNQGRRTLFGSGELDDPTFDDGTAEAFEDFEEEWSDVLIIALVADLAEQYEAHRVMIAGGVHGNPDNTNQLTEPYPPHDLEDALALANNIRTKYEAHRVMISDSVHGNPDNTNAVTAPAATTWIGLVSLVNELKIDLDLHRVMTTGGVHGAADNVNDVTAPDAWDTRRLEFSVSQLDDPTFDSGTPEAFEDFEEEWSDNEDRRTAFGGGELDSATFQKPGGTKSFDTFEEGPLVAVPAGVAIGAPTSVDSTQANRVVFGGSLTGTIKLQYRRDGFATWETWDTITTVPAEVEILAGISEVRIERTIVGGTTTAEVRWPILTEL